MAGILTQIISDQQTKTPLISMWGMTTARTALAYCLQSLSHITKAFSKSASLTSLTMQALPIPTGKGKRCPIEFCTRSLMASAKSSRVRTGLYTGTWQMRSMSRMASRSSTVILPKTLASTVMYAMSQATASPCLSSYLVPRASISKSCPMAWPKSTRRSKLCSQRLGASSSSMVSIESLSTRSGTSSEASRGSNRSSTRRGAFSFRRWKSSSDFIRAILAISPRLLETSRFSWVLMKELSRSAATGGT
mmetsp:Transcript_74161/g.164011  ORF Transcript_74161/g.164011 Transcript_74161/m.164011 type:complete len:249 (-) Transcript_74161:13-759(-)